VCILFNIRPTWNNAQALLLRNIYGFHNRLQRFERNQLSLERRLEFLKYVRRLNRSITAIELVSAPLDCTALVCRTTSLILPPSPAPPLLNAR
jgi:hypothetical protein